MDNNDKKNNMTEIFNGVGFAIAVCGLCIGVGSCSYLDSLGAIRIIEAKTKLIEVQNQNKEI